MMRAVLPCLLAMIRVCRMIEKPGIVVGFRSVYVVATRRVEENRRCKRRATSHGGRRKANGQTGTLVMTDQTGRELRTRCSIFVARANRVQVSVLDLYNI